MTDLSSSTAPEQATSARSAARSSASAQLGGTLRSILLSPEAGFRGAYALADKKQRFGARVPEGAAPFVMGACGGAALMMLWLKLGGLLNLRSISPADFEWSYVVAAAVGGAVVGLLAQFAWGSVGRLVMARLGSPTTAPRMRLAWGASALPQVFALIVLFPLDVVFTGRSLFTGERITDTFPAMWAALSVAFAVSLAAWSGFLFFKGVQAGSGAGASHVGLGILAAFGCLVLVVAAFVVAAMALAGAGA